MRTAPPGRRAEAGNLRDVADSRLDFPRSDDDRLVDFADDDRLVDFADDDSPLLPDQTRDDTDSGWGEPVYSNDDRLLGERPPHWE